MSLQMRLLHGALRLLSDYLMLPLFGLFGGTRDSLLGGRLCVLYTVGRKSGLRREIPLSYARTTAGVAVLAGFGKGTGWAYNLRARPEVEVLVGRQRHAATAVEVTDPALALAATRAVMCSAGVAGFFYGWDPRRASEEQLGHVVDDTICFHLRFETVPIWSGR